MYCGVASTVFSDVISVDVINSLLKSLASNYFLTTSPLNCKLLIRSDDLDVSNQCSNDINTINCQGYTSLIALLMTCKESLSRIFIRP